MRATEFTTKIKEAGEPETVYQQDIGVGTPQATNSVGTNADTVISPDHGNAETNPAKVKTDDPYTQTMVNPLQQEIEMLKKAAGKDASNIDHVFQSSKERGPHIPWDEPLVDEPQTMDGQKPGLTTNLKKDTEASPNAMNTGQWKTKDSNSHLGSDTEKRVTDAEQMRQNIDKVANDQRNAETQASAGASELSTKAGIPSSYGK
jgi:hypothetical protein